MYHGNNPTALRSQAWILHEFLRLLHEKPLRKITIKEIMCRCDMARQTFYQIFRSKEEIIEYYLDRLFSAYIEQSAADRDIHTLCDAAKMFFQFFDGHLDFIEALVENDMLSILQSKCRAYMLNGEFVKYFESAVRSDAEKAYAVTFFTFGMTGMLAQWLKDGKRQSTEDLAKLVCRITGYEET